MNYNFPIIAHIDDVLPVIKDSPEFIVVDKEDYIVINYVVMNENTFPNIYDMFTIDGPVDPVSNTIRRECRGLIFNKDGKLINRRFHKFFNVNERDETRHEVIDWLQPHHIFEKLDGSMVSPCRIEKHIRWMTKMGITDTSMEAEVFVATHHNYSSFADVMIQIGMTPIFEWCSNKNRIVLDYPDDQLVLLAIRDNITGRYLPYENLSQSADMYNIPVVKVYHSYDSNKILEIVRGQQYTEGVVIRFDDGHMVKVKSDWYVRLHKVMALIGNERDIVSMILNNQLDDIIPVLPQETVDKINSFKEKLQKQIDRLAHHLFDTVNYLRNWSDRKSFALGEAKNCDPLIRALIFKFWDGELNINLTYEAIVAIILKNCGSNSSYAKIKEEILKGIDYE